jgi:hypothetical protein
MGEIERHFKRRNTKDRNRSGQAVHQIGEKPGGKGGFKSGAPLIRTLNISNQDGTNRGSAI